MRKIKIDDKKNLVIFLGLLATAILSIASSFNNNGVIILFMVISTIFLYLFFMNEKFALMILLLSLTMDKISVTVSGITVTIGMVMILLTMFKFFVSGFMLKIKKESNTIKKVMILSYLLVVSLIISAILSIDKSAAISKTFQFIFLICTLWIFYIYTIRMPIKVIVKYMIIASSFNLLLGIAQVIGYKVGFDVNSIFSYFEALNGKAYYGISMMEINGDTISRMNGFFVDPSPFAGYMLSVIPLCFVNIREKFELKKILYSIALCCACIFSFSRSSWLGLGFCLIVMLIYINIKKVKGKWLFNLIVIGSVGMLIFNYQEQLIIIVERLLQTFSGSDASTLGHKNMATYAVEAFKTSPIIGIGLNNFKDFVGFNTMTHSMYLTFLCETGLIGTSLFLGIWGLIIFRLNKVRKYNRGYSNMFMLIIFILLICNIGYDYYNQLFIWCYLGMVVGYIDKFSLNDLNAK